MKASWLVFGFAALFAPAFTLKAAVGSSANYTITVSTNDGGGARSSSSSYTNDGSVVIVGGISNVATPSEIAKSGYVAQLYDVTGLAVTAVAPTVNEASTVQLGASQSLDDGSYLAVDPSIVTWGVVSGPIGGITTGGLATTGAVYQATPATVRAGLGGFTGTFNLTVLDTLPDNYGSYANDSLPDSWQAQYFGLNNPKAAPSMDADGTGQPNLFKYLAGLDPTNPNSKFTLTILSQGGQPGQKQIILTPIISGRTYTVQYKTSLLGNGGWNTLSGITQRDNGNTRTVNDSGATGSKFYRVQISKP